MKSLENLAGLQEMNIEEMNEANGGFLFVIPALALYFGGASLACCAITGAAYLGYYTNR